MKRVLFCGTYPGVTNYLTNFLADHCDLYHLAFQGRDDIPFESNEKIKRICVEDFGLEEVSGII